MKRIFAGLLAAIFLCGMIPALAEPVADAALLPLPMGDPNPASRFMFTGQSYIFRMVERDTIWNADTMMNVTFEPCCRTDWHSHAGGQILIAVGGIGIHQVEGQEPELLLAAGSSTLPWKPILSCPAFLWAIRSQMKYTKPLLRWLHSWPMGSKPAKMKGDVPL